MTSLKARFRKEDPLGKIVLGAELMGLVGLAMAVVAWLLAAVR